MNDWFIWKGTRCTSYGIHVLTQPDLICPAERATFTPIPGRSGTLTTLEGEEVYDDIILSAECIIENTSRLMDICGWLRGGGTVTFANRRGGYYNARIVNQISFEKILRGNPHRSFAVNFRCQPFFYLTPGNPITITGSNTFITNPGSVSSAPKITVYGSGDITPMIGMTIIQLAGIVSSIVIDSELLEASDAGGFASMNSYMSGDFPMLLPGANAVSWTGTVHSVVIEPRWRTL